TRAKRDWSSDVCSSDLPLSQPQVDIDELPDSKTNEGVLKFSGELDIKPVVELPDYAGLEVEVEVRSADEEAVQKELDELRSRFEIGRAARREREQMYQG